MTPPIIICLPSGSPGSVFVPVPQDHNSPASWHRQKPKGEGWGRASGREPGWFLSEARAPGCLTFCTHKIPRSACFWKAQKQPASSSYTGLPISFQIPTQNRPSWLRLPWICVMVPALMQQPAPAAQPHLRNSKSQPQLMQQLECTEHHSALVGTDIWANAPVAAGRGGKWKGKLVHKTAN